MRRAGPHRCQKLARGSDGGGGHRMWGRAGIRNGSMGKKGSATPTSAPRSTPTPRLLPDRGNHRLTASTQVGPPVTAPGPRALAAIARPHCAVRSGPARRSAPLETTTPRCHAMGSVANSTVSPSLGEPGGGSSMGIRANETSTPRLRSCLP